MWPLSLVLLFATAAPQQPAAPPQLTAQQKQRLESARQKAEKAAKASEYQLLHPQDTCYTLRSYFFHPQDGQAPVPAGMTTCTPANKFQPRSAQWSPIVKYPGTDLKIIGQQASQQDNTCFTMRSYYFRRQDGQAPVLASTSTCTPASKLQQKQVSPEPGAMFVPLGLQTQDHK